jgi:hypothetical protein
LKEDKREAVVYVCCTFSLGGRVLYIVVGLLWEHGLGALFVTEVLNPLYCLALKERLEIGSVTDKHRTYEMYLYCHC